MLNFAGIFIIPLPGLKIDGVLPQNDIIRSGSIQGLVNHDEALQGIIQTD